MVYKQYSYIIRLQRGGIIRRPFWRIVVQKKLYGISRAPIAVLGYYNVFHGSSRFNRYKETRIKARKYNLVVVNFELLNLWLIKGARPTIRVEKLLF